MWRKFPFGILYFQLRFVNHDKEFWESTLNSIIVLRSEVLNCSPILGWSGSRSQIWIWASYFGVIRFILKTDSRFRNQTIRIGWASVFFIVQTKISVCLRIERIWARINPCSISDRSLDYMADRSKVFFSFEFLQHRDSRYSTSQYGWIEFRNGLWSILRAFLDQDRPNKPPSFHFWFGILGCQIGSPVPRMKRTHRGCLLWSIGHASAAYRAFILAAATSACNSGFASEICEQGIRITLMSLWDLDDSRSCYFELVIV